MLPQATLISRSWSFKEAKKSSIPGLKLGLKLGLVGGLLYGLINGLKLGLIFGLVGGLVGSEVDIKKRPNQGIWKSANKALFITLTFLLISGLVIELIYGLIYGLIVRLVVGLVVGLIGGLSSAAGKAAIQHLALRFTLHRSGSIPWNYARFLNYCTELCILQRVGGRYRFIHKQMQDYFAESVNQPNSK